MASSEHRTGFELGEKALHQNWDEALAARLIGSVLLVGMTWVRDDGHRFEQFFGTVIAADPDEGIDLRLAGANLGEIRRIPPDTDPITAAGPGIYRLHATGEEIDRPDFVCGWTIYPKGHPFVN